MYMKTNSKWTLSCQATVVHLVTQVLDRLMTCFNPLQEQEGLVLDGYADCPTFLL